MSGKTKIEWATRVWNPSIGCTRVSEGCRHCYAFELHNMRHKAFLAGKRLPLQYAATFDQVELMWNRLEDPLHWRKPQRIFVDSMSDLFHKDVPFDFILRVWMTMAKTPQHTFIILTKRPDRMMTFVNGSSIETLPNVWLGVSVENQAAANERIPLLLQTRAEKHIVSVEPMLGPVDLVKCFKPIDFDWERVNALQVAEPEEFVEECEAECDWINFGNDLVVNPEYEEWTRWRKHAARLYAMERQLDWVICGCESGPGARPFEMDWAINLSDQCRATWVKFFFKQGRDEQGKLVKMPKLDGRTWAEIPGEQQ